MNLTTPSITIDGLPRRKAPHLPSPLTQRSQHPPVTYRLLVSALLPLIGVFTAKQAWPQHDGRYLAQRFGWHYPRIKAAPLWVHCASVGEVRAATPLLRLVHQLYPALPLLISTGTRTSGELCGRTLDGIAQHVYLPLDTRGAVTRFLKAIKPRAGLVMETEIWPTLYARCRQAGIPLVIVNGRLSDKTLKAPSWLLKLYTGALQNVSAVLARSALDANGFARLGMPVDRIQTLGNIKLGGLGMHATPQPLLQRDYWLAASTHDNEEAQLGELLKATRSPLLSDTLLVIAPRHPHRSQQIEASLNTLGLECAVRSRDDPVSAKTRIYLADTLGELEAWMAHAKLVFMGGSLIPVGGHNLLEPAALGKAIISGPHLKNFRDESRILQDASAIEIVNDLGALEQQLLRLLGQPAACSVMGERAAAAVLGFDDIVEDYLDALMPFISFK